MTDEMAASRIQLGDEAVWCKKNPKGIGYTKKINKQSLANFKSLIKKLKGRTK